MKILSSRYFRKLDYNLLLEISHGKSRKIVETCEKGQEIELKVRHYLYNPKICFWKNLSQFSKKFRSMSQALLNRHTIHPYSIAGPAKFLPIARFSSNSASVH